MNIDYNNFYGGILDKNGQKRVRKCKSRSFKRTREVDRFGNTIFKKGDMFTDKELARSAMRNRERAFIDEEDLKRVEECLRTGQKEDAMIYLPETRRYVFLKSVNLERRHFLDSRIMSERISLVREEKEKIHFSSLRDIQFTVFTTEQFLVDILGAPQLGPKGLACYNGVMSCGVFVSGRGLKRFIIKCRFMLPGGGFVNVYFVNEQTSVHPASINIVSNFFKVFKSQMA